MRQGCYTEIGELYIIAILLKFLKKSKTIVTTGNLTKTLTVTAFKKFNLFGGSFHQTQISSVAHHFFITTYDSSVFRIFLTFHFRKANITRSKTFGFCYYQLSRTTPTKIRFFSIFSFLLNIKKKQIIFKISVSLLNWNQGRLVMCHRDRHEFSYTVSWVLSATTFSSLVNNQNYYSRNSWFFFIDVYLYKYLICFPVRILDQTKTRLVLHTYLKYLIVRKRFIFAEIIFEIH